jgi:hypothetical protein
MGLPPGPWRPAGDGRGRCRAWWGSVSGDKVDAAIYRYLRIAGSLGGGFLGLLSPFKLRRFSGPNKLFSSQ